MTEQRRARKGAVPYKGGCRFGVWAPHAGEVYVVGSFNGWDKTVHPMSGGDDGVWTADIPGVKAGDEYLYRIVAPGGEFMRIDPYARRVTNSAGNGIVKALRHKRMDAFTPPTLDKMVIYELHIGTFGKKEGADGPGDLETAMERLEYLKELGVNAVEIMPLSEFAGGYSWGYNPAHIFAVESDYGSPRNFREFVDRAHQLGIAVIIDVVYNHFGPGDLDLWQFDGWSEDGKGGIYFYNDWRAQTPWGETRPDYGRGEVREYIRDNALMWFREYGVDGLRWDMTAYIRNVHGMNDDAGSDLPDGWSLMQWVNREIRRVKKNGLTIAEDLQDNGALTRAVKNGGAGFDAQWGAVFVHALRPTLTALDDKDRSMEAVKGTLLHRYSADAFERVVYTESHDEVANGRARVPEEIDPGKASSWAAKKRSTLGAAVVFTAPGVPMLFQGQEFLEDDWFHDQDPLDWSKKERNKGILQLYKDLIALRLNREGWTAGLTGQHIDILAANEDLKCIAYHRWRDGGSGDSTVVVANFSANVLENFVVAMPAEGEWTVRFNSDGKGYDGAFGDMGPATVRAEKKEGEDHPAAAVTVAPYSAIILSQTRS